MVVAMVIAVIVALALRESFIGKKIVLFLFQYNICLPHIVAAMMMIMLLSQIGLLSSLAYRLGITESAKAFPWLVRDSKADPFAWLTGWSNAPTYANPVVVACGSLYSVADVTRAYHDVVARVGFGA